MHWLIPFVPRAWGLDLYAEIHGLQTRSEWDLAGTCRKLQVKWLPKITNESHQNIYRGMPSSSYHWNVTLIYSHLVINGFNLVKLVALFLYSKIIVNICVVTSSLECTQVMTPFINLTSHCTLFWNYYSDVRGEEEISFFNVDCLSGEEEEKCKISLYTASMALMSK